MRFQRHISQGGSKTNGLATYVVIISLVSFVSVWLPQYSIATQPELSLVYDDAQLICREINMSPIEALPDIPAKEYEVKKTFWTTVTAYSSSPDETSGDPFVTASGERTANGIMAHQYLPFGTKVRFPDQFGDKIFVIQDRLHERHTSQYLFDMWVHSKAEAKAWGAKILKVEILK
ncbi:MAG: hypothetical protein ABIB97_02065 [Patescibacteria group bacterium]